MELQHNRSITEQPPRPEDRDRYGLAMLVRIYIYPPSFIFSTLHKLTPTPKNPSIAFGALIALNMILIDDLNMFAKIIERTQSRTQGHHTLHDDIVERVSEFGAVGNTGNYYLQRPAAATPRRRASGGNCV